MKNFHICTGSVFFNIILTMSSSVVTHLLRVTVKGQHSRGMVETDNIRGHPCAKDCMRPTGKDRKIMKRDLGGLYAVGVFRLNKVGGFIFGVMGTKNSSM